MKISEIFKALEEGKIIISINGIIKYKLIDGELHRQGTLDESWKKDNGNYLVNAPQDYEIKPERVMDLSKVKPEEIVHVNGHEVLSITEMINSKKEDRFVVVFDGDYNNYFKDGRLFSDEEPRFRFKDGVE